MGEVAEALGQLHGVAALGTGEASGGDLARTVLMQGEPRHTTLGQATGVTGQSRRRRTAAAVVAAGAAVALRSGQKPVPVAAPGLPATPTPTPTSAADPAPTPVEKPASAPPREAKPGPKSPRPAVRPVSKPAAKKAEPGRPLRNEQVPLFH